jgi:hypothetical protein
MLSSTHKCLRCDRPLRSPRARYCSSQCQELSSEAYGEYSRSLPARIGEDATFDPEDVLYGDYLGDSDGPGRDDCFRTSVSGLRSRASYVRGQGYVRRRS